MISITGAIGNVGREAVSPLPGNDARVRAVTRDLATTALPGGAHQVLRVLWQPETAKRTVGISNR